MMELGAGSSGTVRVLAHCRFSSGQHCRSSELPSPDLQANDLWGSCR